MRIDNSKFPFRKVVSQQPSRAPGASRLLTLECGHQVGLRDGRDVPEQAPCLECFNTTGGNL